MPIKSPRRGKNTSENLEIRGVSKFGIWLLVGQREYFLDFKNHPWFKRATVEQIYAGTITHGKHLRWAELDIDLELESLLTPEKYPLAYR